jgi:hypothetical protein
MKRTTRVFWAGVLVLVLGLSGAAQAALINRGADSLGNRLIYDDDLNITWYDYTNSATYWATQMNWAANLEVTLGSQTFDDWRLPSTVDGGWSTRGGNITSSEMGHLYYTELGNIYSTGLTNTGPFEHLLSADYWSDTDSSLGANEAWYFATYNGYQASGIKTGTGKYALAVRNGDVAVVPVPAAVWLFSTGLMGLLGVGHRQRRARHATPNIQERKGDTR